MSLFFTASTRGARTVRKATLDRHLRTHLGMVLALHGFLTISHLSGLEDVDIDCITSASIFKSLLKRLRSATLPSPQVNPQSSSQSSFSTVSPRSAAMVADVLSGDVVQELEVRVNAEPDGIGLTDFDTTAKPMAVIQRLSRAKSCGVNVQSIVQERTKLLELESVRASLPSVASALKAWHAFATGFLGVISDSTLPPVSRVHFCVRLSLSEVCCQLHLVPTVDLCASQDLERMARPGDQADCHWYTKEELALHRWPLQD